MTTKEITELRKSGNLQGALEAAEENFDQFGDKMAAQSLFWCLNDLCKQPSEENPARFARMKELYKTYFEGDNFMQQKLSATELRLIPHSMELRDALDKIKNNAEIPTSYYTTFKEYFYNNELDSRLFSDFGWLILYTLKNTPLTDALTRKKLLSNYLRLNLEAPSLLHSLIMSEAVAVEKNTPLEFLFSAFVEMWNLDNLREEDWEQFHTEDGKTLPSLVEKIIGVYVKEMKTNNSPASESFCEMFDKALARYTNNQNMPYFKAYMLISQGKKEEAMSYYRDLIIRFPMKAYLWNQLAELVEDKNTKIGLLCRALKTGEPEEFLGNIHLRLASLLVEENKLANARFELDKYAQTYRSKNWNLKSDYWIMDSKLKDIASLADNSSLYSEYFPFADAFIYHDLPSTYAIKVSDRQEDDPKKPGKKITKWLLKSNLRILRLSKPRKFGLDNRMKNGTLFEIKEQSGKIVWIKELNECPKLDWLKTSEGQLTIRTDKNGKGYAIIDHAYIGEKLLGNLKDGQNVSVISIKQEDGRWSAIALSKR